jgi:hypothetical protein
MPETFRITFREAVILKTEFEVSLDPGLARSVLDDDPDILESLKDRAVQEGRARPESESALDEYDTYWEIHDQDGRLIATDKTEDCP